jgi:hypothetical protein
MAKYASRPGQKWTCMCGRTFSRARKCLKCGDDLPWCVYRGEITYAERRKMSTAQYKNWRENRVDEKVLAQKSDIAIRDLKSWLA